MATDTNAVLDMDVKSILEEFADLPDPRSHINRLHLLGDLLVICIMAVIAGAEGPRAIGLWAKSNESWLKGRLRLPKGVPAHDTIGRVLMALKPAVFQACCENWIRRLATNREGEEREIIAIDGKSLRRSHDRAAGLGPLCVVSAWAVMSASSVMRRSLTLSLWEREGVRVLQVRVPRTTQSPARTTRHGLPGRNCWPGWVRSFRSSARRAAATSG